MIRMTTDQWVDLVKMLGSYRADLIEKHGDDAVEYINYIEEFIDEVTDSQANWEVEFTLDVE